MKTLLLQSDNPLDLRLVLDLAKRLGMRYTEIDQAPNLENTSINESQVEDEQTNDDLLEDVLDTSALYEGLHLAEEIKLISMTDLEKATDLLLTKNYIPDFESAKQAFGAWEDDESETLEDLLNMLPR
jgi:hypothetical protein